MRPIYGWISSGKRCGVVGRRRAVLTIVIAEVLVQVNTAVFAGSVGPVGVALKVCSSVLFVNVYV